MTATFVIPAKAGMTTHYEYIKIRLKKTTSLVIPDLIQDPVFQSSFAII